MSEIDTGEVITPQNQEWVELIVSKTIMFRGRNEETGKAMKPGDKISVPSHFKVDGIYPVRWWVYNKAAGRNKKEADAFTAIAPAHMREQSKPAP